MCFNTFQKNHKIKSKQVSASTLFSQMITINPPKSKTTKCYTKSSISDSQKISHIVNYMETKLDSAKDRSQLKFSMRDLCDQFNIRRRVFYDFISILSEFSCCSKIFAEQFVWYGLRNANQCLIEIRNEMERYSKDESIPDSELKLSMNCLNKTSLPHIAIALVKLFFYLNTKKLDLREACKFLISSDPKKYNTLLRKLYTVSSRLQVAGILTKTLNVAEVKICDFDPPQPNFTIQFRNLINTDEELANEQRFSMRRKEYDSVVSPKTTDNSSSSSSSSTKGFLASTSSSSPESNSSTP